MNEWTNELMIAEMNKVNEWIEQMNEMNEWMNEMKWNEMKLNEWMNEMNEWMNGQTAERMNQPTNQSMNKRTKEPMNELFLRWATDSLSQVFSSLNTTEPLLCWTGSSLSNLFLEIPLLSAASYLGYFFFGPPLLWATSATSLG